MRERRHISGEGTPLRATAVAAALQRHVIEPWFPRSIDRQQGGFLCDFDRAWKPRGRQHKLLEFQARQTWIAAELARRFPRDSRLSDAAVHGFRYLRDAMWDREFGGWYHRLNRDGEPIESQTKHVHGIAYAISACSAVHSAGLDPGALDLARRGFEWLEEHAFDREHGGYFGFLTRDGQIIRDAADSPMGRLTDTISTTVGLKDANVHADLVEAFTFLHAGSPDDHVANRLRELVDVFSVRMLHESGALWYYWRPDWRPVPHVSHYGYSFHATNRLLSASEIVGDEQRMVAACRRMVEFSLRMAWDRQNGGFFYAGPSTGPTSFQRHDLVVRAKAWWVQLEALSAFSRLGRLTDGDERYLRYERALWSYMRRHLIDGRHAGFYAFGLDGLPRWRRAVGESLAPRQLTYKGNAWKDASHEGRALLACLRALGGEVPEAGRAGQSLADGQMRMAATNAR